MKDNLNKIIYNETINNNIIIFMGAGSISKIASNFMKINDMNINKIQSKIKSKILLDYDMGKSTWFRSGEEMLRDMLVVNSIKDLKTILSYSR